MAQVGGISWVLVGWLVGFGESLKLNYVLLAGWLVSGLVGWLGGWLVGWLVGRLAGWLAGWLVPAFLEPTLLCIWTVGGFLELPFVCLDLHGE